MTCYHESACGIYFYKDALTSSYIRYSFLCWWLSFFVIMEETSKNIYLSSKRNRWTKLLNIWHHPTCNRHIPHIPKKMAGQVLSRMWVMRLCRPKCERKIHSIKHEGDTPWLQRICYTGCMRPDKRLRTRIICGSSYFTQENPQFYCLWRRRDYSWFLHSKLIALYPWLSDR